MRLFGGCSGFLSLLFLSCSAVETSPSSDQHSPVDARAKSQPSGTSYYIDSDIGNDTNDGMSAALAWKSFEVANGMVFVPGDQILLKAGTAYTGSLTPMGSGSATLPILVDMYDTGDKPFIDSKGYLAGVYLKNQSYVEIHNLRITSDGGEAVDSRAEEERYGVLVEVTDEPHSNILIKDLEIHDIYATVEVESEGTNPTTNEGRGIRLNSAYWKDSVLLSEVTIQSNRIERTGWSGIHMTSSWNDDELVKMSDIQILDNHLEDIGGPGIVPSKVENLLVRGNLVDKPGSRLDPRMHGRGSGIWPLKSDNVVIEKNRFMHARGKEDSCGAHIDIGNTGVIVQYNLSLDNEGGFIEILGGNSNSAYRYNVSINDGERVKDQAADLGHGRLVYLSSYSGSTAENSGLGNSNIYIYNNTMYVKEEIQTAFGSTEMVDGLLIANNVFHVLGETIDVHTAWNDKLDNDDAKPTDIQFSNNLYLNEGTIPETLYIQDEFPIFGDAGFVLPGSFDPNDYAPMNGELIQDQGIVITKLPNDPIGLSLGLEVAVDFLGQPIVGLPDLGAIEYQPEPVDTGEEVDTSGNTDTASETGSPVQEDTSSEEDSSPPDEEDGAGTRCGGCSSSDRGEGREGLFLGLLLGVVAIRRRDF
jgi:hypothetical protein